MDLALSIGLAAHGYMPNTSFMVTAMVMFNSCKQADKTIIKQLPQHLWPGEKCPNWWEFKSR